MGRMSELSADDTHDVIHLGGEAVAVVVPIAEYRQLREMLAEQQINDEFEAAHAGRLARQEAGEIRYVSHEEAGRRLGLSAR
jgi:PHD/YefM family antitoxin component YafN of YafNO toxin-antitoxin module